MGVDGYAVVFDWRYGLYRRLDVAYYDKLYGVVAVDVRRSGVYRRRRTLDGIFTDNASDVYAHYGSALRYGVYREMERLYDAVYVLT